MRSPDWRGSDRLRAYSFVEMTIALAILGVVIGTLAASRFGPGWSVFDPLVGDRPELAPIEQQLRRLQVEIQEGTRVIYPVAGEGPQEGLGLVDSRGRAILYYLEPEGTDGVQTLFRIDLTDWQAGRPGADRPWLGNVRRFQVNVAPAAPGKDPSLVELDLAVGVRARNVRDVRVVNFITSAFLRNLERHVPDDLAPAGTPPLLGQ